MATDTEKSPKNNSSSPHADLASRRNHGLPLGVKVATGLGVVAVAIGLSVWGFRADDTPAPVPAASEQTTRLRLTLRKGDQDTPAGPGFKFKEGDTMGFQYSAPTVVWGLILSCTDRGEIQQLFPSVPATQLAPGQDETLRFSTTLGPVTGRQWIVGYFRPGPEPLPAQALVDGLRRALRDAGPGTPIPPTHSNIEVHVLPVPRD